jgi:phosphoribosylglycinamide formyltransferase-1
VKKIAILISGRGSNMEAIVRAGLPAKICGVISNREGAAGLAFSAQAGIQTDVVDERRFASRGAFDAALAAAIDEHAPDFIALAGFMRILGEDFVERYSGRLLNIHPSLLPAFSGLHTHRRALAEGVKIHGCTVHFVTPQIDRGPIVIQAAVPVKPGDTEQVLAARVLKQEHRIYPQALRWCVEDRLVLEDGLVRVRGADDRQSLFERE